ncbi:MAG: hypothetical protein R3F11_08140 [Verrucomicrobiales bacterium]
MPDDTLNIREFLVGIGPAKPVSGGIARSTSPSASSSTSTSACAPSAGSTAY